MVRKPKDNDQTEWAIKKQVKRILSETGWSYWMPSANAFGRSGQSDFLAVKVPRMFMVIETKYKDMPTALQLAFLEMVHNAGHYAFLVDETNIEKFRHVLMNERMRQTDMRGAGELYHFESLMKWRNPYEYQDQIAEAVASELDM